MFPNEKADISVAFSGGRWVAWMTGDYEIWHDFYPLCMTRAEVVRAARRDFIAAVC